MVLKFISQIGTLISKDLILEWRHKYAINGVLLYTLSTIFICYMSFLVLRGGVNPFSWNALYWIIMLFSAVTAVSKSFVQESSARQMYYFHLVKPEAIISAKIIYNVCFLVLLSGLGYALFGLILGNPIRDKGLFLLAVLLASMGFSTCLTLMSGIASKAENNGMLMAVLSFPVVIPILLMVIKISKNAIDGLARSESLDEVITLLAINVIMGTLAFILFPYLWRS